jgi:hypothetical protein
MPSVIGLRDGVRQGDGFAVVGDSFPFTVESVQGGKVGLRVKHDPEWACEHYRNFLLDSMEFDAARWLPIFEACAAKCREVVATQQVGTIAADLAGRIAEHGGAT